MYESHCTQVCTVYNIPCTIYNVQYTMYNIQCTIYIVYSIIESRSFFLQRREYIYFKNIISVGNTNKPLYQAEYSMTGCIVAYVMMHGISIYVKLSHSLVLSLHGSYLIYACRWEYDTYIYVEYYIWKIIRYIAYYVSNMYMYMYI